MTYAREQAIAGLDMAANHLKLEITRRVVDRDKRAAALGLLAQVLSASIAGTEVSDANQRRVMA